MRSARSNSDPGQDAVRRCLAEYAAKKRAYLDTDVACKNQGLDFIPLIFEAHGGGWSESVCDLLAIAAKRHDTRRTEPHVWGQSTAAIFEQRLSVAIQRATAKAMLRRESPGFDRFQ